MTPALVIFDCDGVLVDSEVLAARAWQAVLRQGGGEVDLAPIERAPGMKQADIVAHLEREIGRSLDPALVDRLWPATRALFADHLKTTLDLAAFLDRLPYLRCVASSSSHERIGFSLGVTGLARYFDPGAIFSASEVARGKPAPDLFLHAAARMGVAPARCVVIEDSKYGVAGAVAAGMTACGFTGGGHATPAMAAALRDNGARWVVETWSDVAAHLGIA